MKRWAKILAAAGACGLALAVATVLLVRSDWFSDRVRERITGEIGRATGGRVEIGSFRFDWRALRVELRELVIHGSEPAADPPLLRVASLKLALRVVSLLERAVDIEELEALQPQIHLAIDPAGRTNLPGPEAPLLGQPVVDLSVRRFSVQDGALEVNSFRNPWSAAGGNLRAVFRKARGPRYTGTVSIEPLNLTLTQNPPVALRVTTDCALETNRVSFSNARLETAESRAELSGALSNPASPETTFQYKLRLSLRETGRVLKLRTPQSGMIELTGEGHFKNPADYLVAGRLHAADLSFGEAGFALRGVRADSAIRIDPTKIELPGLRMAALGGDFEGRAEITALDRFSLAGEVMGVTAQRVAALYGGRPAPWDALVSGSIEVRGLLSRLYQRGLNARLRLVISPSRGSASVHGAIDASFDGGRGILDLADSHLALPSTRLDFSGALGRQLRVRLRSTDLRDLSPALRQPLPVALDHGSAAFAGTITGSLEEPEIAGRLALENFMYAGTRFDAFSGDIDAASSAARVRRAVLKLGGVEAQIEGSAGLEAWRLDRTAGVTAQATVRGSAWKQMAALAGGKNLPLEGAFTASVSMSGTVGEPQVKAGLRLTQGSLLEEPFDRLDASLAYGANRLQVTSGEIAARDQRLRFDGVYTHAPGNLQAGRVRLHAASGRLALEQLRTAQKHWPGVSGWVQAVADGAAATSRSRTGETEFRLTDLTADLTAHGVELDRKPLGDIHVAAATRNAELTARLETAFANAPLQGEGRWKLEPGYPGTMQVRFSRLDFASAQKWWDAPEPFRRVTGWAQGNLSLAGPALEPAAWTGILELAKLEIDPLPASGAAGLSLSNAGPVRLLLERSRVRVESARLVGRNTNMSITGGAALGAQSTLDARAQGFIDLAVLQDFYPDLAGSGRVTADAVVRGPLRQPQVTGRMELKDASLSVTDFPNGLSQINGTVLLEGSRATLQNLTAETGGGKVSLSGFASLEREPAFRIDAQADQVRLRYPEGASTVASAALTWTGSIARSVVSGTIKILRTGLNRRTDFTSLFARSAEPNRAISSASGLLSGVQFDVQIETAGGTSFQTSLAQNLQADANLRLRGTISNPVLLGRIQITQGEMTFFGNKYTISRGTVDFFNPVRLEPNLNIDLQTRARGIDITLTVSGPLNKLSVNYRSDPPLQFSDIVALLATGRAPTTDPALLGRQTGAALSWQQAGASALVGQAISSAGAGRLERFFGVSKIKIDPLLTGVDYNPQARLTLEQNVTPDITLTYITNLTRTNSAFVRIEWSMNREWSVIAVRDESSAFGLDLQFRRRFK